MRVFIWDNLLDFWKIIFENILLIICLDFFYLTKFLIYAIPKFVKNQKSLKIGYKATVANRPYKI